MTDTAQKKRQTFINKCLRRIFNTRYADTISNCGINQVKIQSPPRT